jgi:hypothetical protein
MPSFLTCRSLSLLLLAAAGPCASLLAAPIEAGAPIKYFSLPVFTNEGFRSMLLKGNEAVLVGTQRIDVTDMTLTVFTGKADNRVDTVMTSTLASFFPQEKRAEGDKGVRIIRDDVDMTGTRWKYDHPGKKVVIDGNVRVIFPTQLVDILK